jgi:hypothetical protein
MNYKFIITSSQWNNTVRSRVEAAGLTIVEMIAFGHLQTKVYCKAAAELTYDAIESLEIYGVNIKSA